MHFVFVVVVVYLSLSFLSKYLNRANNLLALNPFTTTSIDVLFLFLIFNVNGSAGGRWPENLPTPMQICCSATALLCGDWAQLSFGLIDGAKVAVAGGGGAAAAAAFAVVSPVYYDRHTVIPFFFAIAISPQWCGPFVAFVLTRLIDRSFILFLSLIHSFTS